MAVLRYSYHRFSFAAVFLLSAFALVLPTVVAAQDPLEPVAGKPAEPIRPRPTEAITRADIDEAGFRSLINQMVSCGTRHTLSSWSDPQRGIGCGRDHVLARLNVIAQASGGRLQIVVDKFEAQGTRTGNKLVPFENIYAILPGSDPALVKTAFIVSGHMDSIPSDVMNPALDAPGADDDASGVAVSVECARLLAPRKFRATLIFAVVSGEEQGLFGSTHMVQWVKDQGYTVGGMLDNDIVGADLAPGGPHRLRLFSGAGEEDDGDSSSRELARAIEEIDGREAVRLVFAVDRLGRGGDHYPFYVAGSPAVRFSEPLEDYHHEHQTPRVENGVEYGDLLKYLDFKFLGNVARDNAEALRELALAPAAPTGTDLSGAATPDANLSWTAPDDTERSGFEILWRETTDPRWQLYGFVTATGKTTLKGISTDNHFFAVRAVGNNGARSIAVPVTKSRAMPASLAPSK
jgi:hypothetical protein